MNDEELTAILGPKCPHCGWRGGKHRPRSEWNGTVWLTACPRTQSNQGPVTT